VVTMGGRRLPACGGGYLRHFPYGVTRWAMRRIARSRPVILYLHPYEMDTVPFEGDYSQLPWRRRRYVRRTHWLRSRNRHTVEDKMHRLLREFSFKPLSEVIADQLRPSPMPASAVAAGSHGSQTHE